MRYISTDDDQIADVLTKGSGTDKFLCLKSKLLVVTIPVFEGG